MIPDIVRKDRINLMDKIKKIYSKVPGYLNTCNIIEAENGVVYIEADIFSDIPFVKQAFSTRVGGVSEGIYESMNLCGWQADDPENVRNNYKLFGEAIGISCDNMICSAQTHTTNVKKAEISDRGCGVIKERDYKDVDALITDDVNSCLVTYYADCIPVIVVDVENKCIGAAHAGWRGTVGNIVKEMLCKMKEEFGSNPKDIRAFVGPGICVDCYEVGENVWQEFCNKYNEKEQSLIINPGKTNEKRQLDLHAANLINLLNEGVLMENISIADVCTCCNSKFLFSHRATAGKRGLLANFIYLSCRFF